MILAVNEGGRQEKSSPLFRDKGIESERGHMAYFWKDWKAFPCADLTRYRQGGGSVFVQPHALSSDKTFCKHTHGHTRALFLPRFSFLSLRAGKGRGEYPPPDCTPNLGKTIHRGRGGGGGFSRI